MNVCGSNVVSLWFKSLLVDLQNGMILNSDSCNSVSEFPDVVSLPSALHDVYSLTPWSRVLLEKLSGFQLVKKFPAFHGTRNVHRVYNSPPPVPILSQINPVHAPHPTS
jgi:hypothetical protein